MDLPRRLSEPGPILDYLTSLRQLDAKTYDKVLAAMRTLLATPDGVILLDLLEKSTILSPVPILADPRALEARNAQGLIALDLRRIMSDETEQLLQRQADQSARRSLARRPA